MNKKTLLIGLSGVILGGFIAVKSIMPVSAFSPSTVAFKTSNVSDFQPKEETKALVTNKENTNENKSETKKETVQAVSNEQPKSEPKTETKKVVSEVKTTKSEPTAKKSTSTDNSSVISKIFINKVGDAQWYNTYSQDLNKVPSTILNKLVGKYTISLVEYTPTELAKYGINKDLAGAFVTGHNVAFVERNLEYGALHETCHAIDTIFSGKNFGYSRTAEFRNIFSAERNNIGLNVYFTSSTEEYFAQTLAIYFVDRSQLSNAPQTIAYFDKLVAELSK